MACYLGREHLNLQLFITKMQKDEKSKSVLTVFVFAFSYFLFFVVKKIVMPIFILGFRHGWMYTFAYCFARLFSGRASNITYDQCWHSFCSSTNSSLLDNPVAPKRLSLTIKSKTPISYSDTWFLFYPCSFILPNDKLREEGKTDQAVFKTPQAAKKGNRQD